MGQLLAPAQGQHRVLTTIHRQLNDRADTVAELIDDDEQNSAEWNGVLDSLYTLMQAAKKEMVETRK